jgi:hypothetical protein
MGRSLAGGVQWPSVFSALVLALLAGPGCATSGTPCAACAGAAVARVPTPRPPGIAVDPVLELPQATANAEPVAGMAVLMEPIDPEPARRVVRAFFDAVVEESVQELGRALDPGALTRANVKTRAEPALSWWRHRFDKLDYTALGAEVFYRRSEMETHTARDTGTLAASRPLPKEPRGDEVVVRVPIIGETADKLFGRELVFLLKKSTRRLADDPSGAETPPAPPEPVSRGSFAGYKIAELFEDFRLP